MYMNRSNYTVLILRHVLKAQGVPTQPSIWFLFLCQFDRRSWRCCAWLTVPTYHWSWLRQLATSCALLLALDRPVLVGPPRGKSLICALSPTAMERQQSMSQQYVYYMHVCILTPIVHTSTHVVSGMSDQKVQYALLRWVGLGMALPWGMAFEIPCSRWCAYWFCLGREVWLCGGLVWVQ